MLVLPVHGAKPGKCHAAEVRPRPGLHQHRGGAPAPGSCTLEAHADQRLHYNNAVHVGWRHSRRGRGRALIRWLFLEEPRDGLGPSASVRRVFLDEPRDDFIKAFRLGTAYPRGARGLDFLQNNTKRIQVRLEGIPLHT